MIDFPWRWLGGGSLTVELAKRDLERKTSERYKEFVVRSRLKRVVKSNATAREEEVQRFPDRYLDSVKSPDGHVLRANREIRDAFRAHFRDRFARCPDLPLQKFRSYLADFPRLITPSQLAASAAPAEAADCEGVITECEVHDALKQVGLDKSPGLDGLPYKVYLRLPHMFVPILTDMFNHWFAQRAIPGSVTKGVITLLKKGGMHVWEVLDDYRPKTLLNTGLSESFTACHLRSDGPRADLRCERKIYPRQSALDSRGSRGDRRGTEAALISLDQSKAFDRVDHRFFGDCFGDCRIPAGVPQMD